MSSLALYYWGNPREVKPAAVVGGIPIGTALEVSHAMSNLDLKYRATGGVFLAHQEGGGSSLRMICETFGPNRYIFLSLIEFLFRWGTSQIIDMTAMSPGMDALFSANKFSRGVDKLPLSKDPWQPLIEGTIEEGREQFHRTFPIITRHRIYTSMYIETMDVVESVEKGMNKLTVTLFFRKFVPPMPPDYQIVLTDKTGKTQIYFREKSRRPNDSQGWDRLKLFFIDTLDHFLSVPLIMVRFLQEKIESPYSFEQLIGFTFANRIDRQSGGTGVDFSSINFKQMLLGV